MDMMIETKCPVCGAISDYNIEYEYEIDVSQNHTETVICSGCSAIYKEETDLFITLDITKSQKIIDSEHDFDDNCSGNLFADQEKEL